MFSATKQNTNNIKLFHNCHFKKHIKNLHWWYFYTSLTTLNNFTEEEHFNESLKIHKSSSNGKLLSQSKWMKWKQRCFLYTEHGVLSWKLEWLLLFSIWLLFAWFFSTLCKDMLMNTSSAEGPHFLLAVSIPQLRTEQCVNKIILHKLACYWAFQNRVDWQHLISNTWTLLDNCPGLSC